ncbi:hypothetical protein P3T29_001885 [Kitasatospora sp. MAP5-34]|nr:hypothetical protein [Kitasatospora sp. MAP5-34]
MVRWAWCAVLAAPPAACIFPVEALQVLGVRLLQAVRTETEDEVHADGHVDFQARAIGAHDLSSASGAVQGVPGGGDEISGTCF